MPSRLKSIELHGFKTFASRTEFVFSPAVTAIVGPNGSGKSNIADAIRWVLGEQSYSLLRAKKTEDVIFSGSENRPRAGMASVTIVFDNSEGWLPIDFSEVAITRRAYRDGQNEYLINGQRVRLRDVSELLSQSGLSERTYTVIGQGLVDAVLALKAEDRRRLFEEAAGIGLHRSRREEALRRLEITRRNLERVQDILAELSPRLRSLEKYARRAQEYERVKADLRLLLRDWYGFHWHRAQKELAEAYQVARTQESALQKARHQQDELGRQLAQRLQEIQQQREQLRLWHNQLSALHTEQEKINREILILEERLRALASQNQSTTLELARLEEEIQYQSELRKAARADLSRWQIEMQDAQLQVDAALSEFQKKQEARKQVELVIEEIQSNLDALRVKQSQLQVQCAEKKNLVEQQMQQIEANERRLTQITASSAQLSPLVQSAQETWKQFQHQLSQLDEELRQTQSEIADLHTQRQAELGKQAEVAAAYSRYQAELEVLDRAEHNLLGYADGAKVLLKAAAEARLRGVNGILSRYIEVAPEYENAILAALGEFLDAVLLDDPSCLVEALTVLQSDRTRSAMVVMNRVPAESPPPFSDFLRLPGFVGFAADLVAAPKDIQPVVRLLLGQVIVVESSVYVDQWIEALQQISSATFRIVTLRGEVFYPGGPVIYGGGKASDSLSRPRRRRNLQAQLEDLESQLADSDQKISQLEEQIHQAKEKENRLRREQHALQIKVQQSFEQYQRYELELEKIQRNAQFLLENSKQLQDEISQHQREYEALEREIMVVEAQVKEVQQRLRQQKALLADFSLEEERTDWAHWNTRLAVARQSLSDAQKRIADLDNGISRAEKSCQALQDRLAAYQVQSAELTEQRGATLEQGKALEAEIQRILERMRPIEIAVAKAEQEYAQLQKLEAETRQNLTLAEHQFAQAKIIQARRQETLESLRRRIEEDFGLVDFRYNESISGPTPLPLDGFVEQLPILVEISPDLEENVKRYQAQLRRIGPVNPELHAEYIQVKERYEFLTEQVMDLKRAEEDIKEVIAELDLLMEREFQRTFESVAHEFRQIFTRLFGGGSARLVLTTPDDLTETGIDIEARLPGRREQGLTLLSGGERSLTAAALIFSLLKVSPTPFCVLDEVDAMLDESNVGRYRDLLGELSEKTQFIVITHNRNTVQSADVIYGVTMGSDSTSQVISLRLDEIPHAAG